MLGASRLLILLFAALFVGGGVLAIVSEEPGGIFAGVILIVLGAGAVFAVAFERTRRYRSDPEQRPSAPAGPGGEAADEPLEPRFQSTGEVFIDPTSGERMRVYLDPATGERRYRAGP